MRASKNQPTGPNSEKQDSTTPRALTRSGRSVQQHTLRRLDSECLEESRVTERQLDHLADHAELLANTTEIIIADLTNTARQEENEQDCSSVAVASSNQIAVLTSSSFSSSSRLTGSPSQSVKEQ
jgi:hypothetical protein